MTSLSDIAADVLRLFGELGFGLIRNNGSKIAGRLRRFALGTQCQIDTAVVITHPRHFRAGPGTALRHGCHIGNTHGRVRLGRRSHLGAYCHVNAVRGEVNIGDDVAIGPGTKIVSYSNAYVPGKDICSSTITDDVVIGDHVFIGANATILPGTVIESNVVIGAGTVVRGHLASHGLYVGAPCRRARELSAARAPGTDANA